MPSEAGNTFGTNSPPLTASGQDKPMGVSGISGHKPDAVPDSEQRQAYFNGSSKDDTSTAEAQSQYNPQSAEKMKRD
ncbi:hypothetical protein PHLGIDRAFT_127034 [Phlebiopsis gigantea 11061_1 CR5-6]|uniref:Uncharacterized protein n=1 Tax=Phlebiopsis gigantea (strain 11061_1 CR5-6) TaxID=745531 RepID=A0A0C3S0I6_PHLG1|nr:hypothetical protein PHLGIDRAFT_127034 [Phlebiopsis gigantea 11061_1 CR5-6]